MVAIFTPQKELAQRAQERAAGPGVVPDQQAFPAARFKGGTLYEGRIGVQQLPGNPVEFELLDGTYAGAGIVATDEIFVETDSGWLAGAWTVGTVTDPSAEVTPLDPPEVLESVQLDGSQPVSSSASPTSPNIVRGAGTNAVVLEARLSSAIPLPVINHRRRGTLGLSAQGASDNLRQLTFDGPVSGGWDIGSDCVGATSGAQGVVVQLSPKITLGGSGHWIIVDMGVDYVGPEYTPGEVVDGSGADPGSGTLRSDSIGSRSTGALFRSQGPAPLVQPIPMPALGNLQHYYDLQDRETVFAGPIGGPNVPAEDQDGIRQLDDKGFDNNKLLRTTFQPIFNVGTGPNGTNYVSHPGGTSALQSNPAPPNGSGVGGMTMFAVFRRVANTAVNRDQLLWQALILRSDNATNQWQYNTGGGFVNMKAQVVGQWEWAYVAIDLAGNFEAKISGVGKVSGAGATYNDASPNSTIQFGETDLEIAEGGYYDKRLSLAEQDQLEARFIERYAIAA